MDRMQYTDLFSITVMQKALYQSKMIWKSWNKSKNFSGLQKWKAETHNSRDHSFLRNVEFWAEPRNLPISTEFLCFHGIMQNLVPDGDKGTNKAYFDGVQAIILYVYTISPWNTWLPVPLGLRALTAGILKILSWAYLKYCRLIW